MLNKLIAFAIGRLAVAATAITTTATATMQNWKPTSNNNNRQQQQQQQQRAPTTGNSKTFFVSQSVGQKQPPLSAFLACDYSVVAAVVVVAAVAAFVAAGIVPKIVAAAVSCQLIELARQTRQCSETRRETIASHRYCLLRYTRGQLNRSDCVMPNTLDVE